MGGRSWSSSRGGDVGGWDGAWTSDGDSGSLSDNNGLVVNNEVSWLWAVGGEVSDNNVSGDGNVTSSNDGGNGQWGSDLSELHC